MPDADEDLDKVEAFYRTLSTEMLKTARGALQGDLKAALRRPRRVNVTIDFCQRRIALIDVVLKGRGVTE